MNIDLLVMYGELTMLLKEQGSLTKENNLMWEVAYQYYSKRRSAKIILIEEIEYIKLKIIYSEDEFISLDKFINLSSYSIMDEILGFAHRNRVVIE
ncbi:MAG: hypothetical protein U9N59_12310 [Campylobacterota bacterium]|nr:hypothetical protein [Campylobacterota bacterium]